MEIVIASHNRHKVREYRDLLKSFKQFDILSLHHFPHYTSAPELGETFEENATAKAQHAALSLKKWILADDSGLIVPMLQGAPGINSRRYAGEESTDSENRKKLLRAMAGLTGVERSAYFHCALALSNPEGQVHLFAGRCEGEIVLEERGRHGFGYDPLFLKHGYDKTFGQIEASVKDRISHRAKAFSKLAIFLEGLK